MCLCCKKTKLVYDIYYASLVKDILNQKKNMINI